MLWILCLAFISLTIFSTTGKVITPLSIGSRIKPKVTPLNEDKFLITTFFSRGSIFAMDGNVLNRFAFSKNSPDHTFSERSSAHAEIVLNEEKFIVAWIEYDGYDHMLRVHSQRYNKKGNEEAKRFLVSSHMTFLDGPESISIILLKDGGYLIAWSWESILIRGGDHWLCPHTYAQIYNSDDTPRGEQIELLVSKYLGELKYNPTITYSDQEGFVVFWEEFTIKWSPIKIRGQFYDSQGQKIGGVITVDDTKGKGDNRKPTSATLESGDIILVWRERENEDGPQRLQIHAKILNPNGTHKGEKFVVQTNGYCASSKLQFSVAALNGNGFVIVWSCGEPEQIYFRTFRAEGKFIHNPPLVNDLLGHGECRNPSVTGLKDGGFIIAWDFCSRDVDTQDIDTVDEETNDVDTNNVENDDEDTDDDDTSDVDTCLMYAQKFDSEGVPINFYRKNRYDDL